VQPETKGFWNPFQFSPTPAKTHQSNTKNGAQSVRGFVPKNSKKKEKNRGDLKKLGFGFLWKKWKNGGENGGKRWVWLMQKGQRWYGGWWGSDGWWWVLDFREFGGVWEERNGEGRGEAYIATVKWGKGEEK
jgi:hypothetical protein